MSPAIEKQWIGAVYAEDLGLMKAMLAEDPALVNSFHKAFDDPYGESRFPVASLVFAVSGPPAQQIDWRQIERRNNFEMVRLLIDAGADPNIDNIHGRPLCLCREENVARYLIEHGADVNLWHDNGGAPIYFSVWQMDPERLKIQLRLGADATQINPHNGSSALHSAAEVTTDADRILDHREIIQILVDADVDPNHKAGIDVQSDWGPYYQADTAFHMAAIRNVPPVIEALIEIGCDLTVRNAKGETPLDVAKRENRPEDVCAVLYG